MTTLLPEFHLPTFTRDLDRGEATLTVRHYDTDAQVRVLHLDEPRESLEVIRGCPGIAQWLGRSARECVHHQVVKVVDGGDRVTFHEQRLRTDGLWVVAMSVAEIHRGLIGHQYVIVGWDDPRPVPVLTGGRGARPATSPG